METRLPVVLGGGSGMLISDGWIGPHFNRDKPRVSQAGTEQVEELDDLNLFRQLADSLPTK